MLTWPLFSPYKRFEIRLSREVKIWHVHPTMTSTSLRIFVVRMKTFASLAMRSSADSDQTARIWRLICVSAYFTKKCLYYFDPLKTPLLYSKTGVYRSIIIFLIFARKHRLWVLVRAVLTNTHSLCFRAKIRKYQSIYLKILSFWRWNFCTFEQACFHDGSAHVRRYVFWRYCSFSFLPRR